MKMEDNNVFFEIGGLWFLGGSIYETLGF